MTSLLLDSLAVISFHETSTWKAITKIHHIYVPSIVINDEAWYYEENDGREVPILLSRDKENGLIEEVTMMASHLDLVRRKFDPVFGPEIHAGELEAIAALMFGNLPPEISFCTHDKAAIYAAVLLGLQDKCISIEEVLDRSGLSRTVEYGYSKKQFLLAKRRGFEMRVQGRGLAKGP